MTAMTRATVRARAAMMAITGRTFRLQLDVAYDIVFEVNATRGTNPKSEHQLAFRLWLQVVHPAPGDL